MDYKTLTLITIATIIVGCNKAVFDPLLPTSPTAKINDATPSLKYSKLQVSSPNMADGVNPANVTIILKTENNEPIVGYKISIKVSGSQNTIVPCTETNEDGKSVCWIYSSKAEEKEVRTVGAIELVEDTTFLPPAPIRSTFAIVSSGSFITMPTGQRIISASGIMESNIRLADSNGVIRVKTSILSSITE